MLYIYSVHQPLSHTLHSYIGKITSTHTLSGAGIRTTNLPVIRRPTLPPVKMYCKVKATDQSNHLLFAVLWITAKQESISAWPQRQGQFDMLLLIEGDKFCTKTIETVYGFATIALFLFYMLAFEFDHERKKNISLILNLAFWFQ